MSNPHDADTKSDLSETLRNLREDLQPPPPDLESRVISRLVETGLLEHRAAPTQRFRRSVAAGLAAALIFTVGFAIGRLPVPQGATVSTEARWALLLHEGTEVSASDEALRVEAVVEWLRTVRARGIEIDGEPLGTETWWIEPLPTPSADSSKAVDSPPRSTERISGFLLLEEKELATVLEIARDSPFREWDVRIEVRPIGPT